ncbi:heme NO-binding domain-containing protein [Vibrio sonorensis]|uniref:heme NO-binding domain-containing protein n=1 Tax=Vibrio sonorensis TaxID=1004316 RepID=UPI0008DA94B2|nr:heme NO-binding domain-containing protein [Vibrio sonorensis]
MKGIIFTEFMELVEREFGLELLDRVLADADDQGIYTSVGSYDHKDLVKLIVSLSKETGIAPEALQTVFGKATFMNLYKSVPESANLKSCKNCFQFIRLVEEHIHLEVKKLYGDANPPKFVFISETETVLEFDYLSARCMAHVCLGLIEGCADFFDQSLRVEMDPKDGSGDTVRFVVTLNEA